MPHAPATTRPAAADRGATAMPTATSTALKADARQRGHRCGGASGVQLVVDVVAIALEGDMPLQAAADDGEHQLDQRVADEEGGDAERRARPGLAGER